MERKDVGDTNCDFILGTIPKWLVNGLENMEIREQEVAIQSRTLIRLSKILRRVQETWEDFAVTQIQVRNAGMKKSQNSK